MRFLSALVVTFLLVACSSNGTVAPVHRLGAAPPAGSRPSFYIVKRGDTLYSIGWRYGLHYRKLARWNRIRSPDTIYVGQKLRLKPPSSGTKSSQAIPSTPKPKQKANEREAKDGLDTKTPSPPKGEESLASKKAPVIASSVNTIQGIQWRWPTQGKVIQGFSSTEPGRKGVDIAGQLGQPIVAVAEGKVVYSGMGLPRYGKLIIVKHDNHFLSAYAHNRTLISKEGDWVKGGQRIAEMGRSGTNRVKLHFEIRYQGQPVDPLRYLPKQ